MATILIVEDDTLIALALQRQLTRLGHTVLPPVASATDGLAAVQAHHQEIVFMDLYRSDTRDRLEAGQRIEAAGTPVIFLSHESRADFTANHWGTAPQFHLEKPFTPEAVVRTLGWALPYGTLQTLQQGVVENHAQVTELEARVKEFVQQVHELHERIAGRDPATEEEPPVP